MLCHFRKANTISPSTIPSSVRMRDFVCLPLFQIHHIVVLLLDPLFSLPPTSNLNFISSLALITSPSAAIELFLLSPSTYFFPFPSCISPLHFFRSKPHSLISFLSKPHSPISFLSHTRISFSPGHLLSALAQFTYHGKCFLFLLHLLLLSIFFLFFFFFFCSPSSFSSSSSSSALHLPSLLLLLLLLSIFFFFFFFFLLLLLLLLLQFLRRFCLSHSTIPFFFLPSPNYPPFFFSSDALKSRRPTATFSTDPPFIYPGAFTESTPDLPLVHAVQHRYSIPTAHRIATTAQLWGGSQRPRADNLAVNKTK
ncbi:unnamed protein product [Acanthosepion pharaonis]|uniref:Uncharacterized protein n=1 Tax=Acanthosepion pharaonis TaxID=158019 RepID=A0A812E2U0_ACAPH|nr:unnamed protein product [Sepia pharaonis]